MQPLDAGRLRVRERSAQALLQIGEPIGQRGKAFLAGLPIARRQVEQRLRQAVFAQPLADGPCRMVIGKQEFDRGEARLRRRLKRSRNGTSLNIKERLAAKRGIIYLLMVLFHFAGQLGAADTGV
jgi:hypothetical protein